MAKIKLEDLNKNSTPCEICVAINKRDIDKNKSGDYFGKLGCTNGRDYNKSSFGSICTDADKVMIKLLYLNWKK